MSTVKALKVVFDGGVDVLSQNDVVEGQVVVDVCSPGLKKVKGETVFVLCYISVQIFLHCNILFIAV